MNDHVFMYVYCRTKNWTAHLNLKKHPANTSMHMRVRCRYQLRYLTKKKEVSGRIENCFLETSKNLSNLSHAFNLNSATLDSFTTHTRLFSRVKKSLKDSNCFFSNLCYFCYLYTSALNSKVKHVLPYRR